MGNLFVGKLSTTPLYCSLYPFQIGNTFVTYWNTMTIILEAPMEALKFSSFHFTTILPKPQVGKLIPTPFNQTSHFFNSSLHMKSKSKFSLFTALSFSPTTEQEDEAETRDEMFDWHAQWYPVMPVCDLDKRAPHGKRVMGIDIVVWWDKNDNSWKVFDDACPHRLAPFSEGRIDQWGRLQCVYHGWCFSGNGDCKFIPQAPRDGPPIHTNKKACAVAYPSVVQNDIVWFWPNPDPKYSDILSKKKPPYIPELDDPSFTKLMGNRDIPYGYDVLIDNLMDPAHVPYAHYGLMRLQKRKESEKADREGGRPLEINVDRIDVNGFSGNQGGFESKFIAPCVFYAGTPLAADSSKGSASSLGTKELSSGIPQKRVSLIFICIPVSPGNSRVIWCFPRNFALWIDQIIPRWIFHVRQNLLVLDSDLYLLHAEERKLMEIGPSNWKKACFLPTKADAQVIAFRKWLNKYAGGQVDWGTKFTGALPPTPPREQLMDRYWTHVVNCRSCNRAYKGLSSLEVVLQIASIALIGTIAATKQNMLSVVQRNTLISVAIVCFVGSRWLSHFVYKSFRFHDYNHAFH